MQAVHFIYFGIFTLALYSAIVWFSVFFKNRSRVFNNPVPKRFPSLTFLVPVYNGEKCIKKCLDGLLNLEYPKDKLKITVIDDGSTDNSAAVAGEYKNIKVIRQDHQGKAAAINNGLEHVKTELFACMDVDSVPKRNYLMKMVGYFEDGKTSAVTPALKVFKTNSIIRKTQWVEYMYMIFLRKAFSIFNCEFVIPGPGGIFRTSVLKKIGGFDRENPTEDTEIAFRLQSHGYKIRNSINAFVYTDTPNNFKGLWRQRVRWYRGYIQNIKKYFRMIANPKYGNFGLFLLPVNNLMIITGWFLLFSQTFFALRNITTSLINWSHIGFAMMPIEFNIFSFLNVYSFFALVFLFIATSILWVSIKYSGEKVRFKERIKFYLSFIFIYPFFICAFWIVSFIYETFGVKRKW